MKIWRRYEFAAAHQLKRLPKEHKCHSLHGHNWQVEICLEGPVDPFLGWVADYAEIDAAWKALFSALDHSNLNDIPELASMPTSEGVAAWIWDRLSVVNRIGDLLCEVRVSENGKSGCSYGGESC